uniref:Uncharacterized protein n=1 Tax=Arundo donax TaxID=35708 RepID=A0A0A9ENZ1_ARUDO
MELTLVLTRLIDSLAILNSTAFFCRNIHYFS